MPNYGKICVVGLGYIGLPTAALLATKGYHVSGVDISPDVVASINAGFIHIVENDLDVLVKSAVNSKQLSAFLTPQPADIFIIAVPTPFKDDHVPDLTYVKTAVESIAPLLAAGNLVILESTSPVGTTEKISRWLNVLRPDLNIPETDIGVTVDDAPNEQVYIAHCPERVLPGQIIKELVENDRVIGGIGVKSSERAKAFYKTFVTGDIWVTKAKTAEMSKLTENAFRDVNIAFANELANISSVLGVEIGELITLANRHPRVNILSPGPGVGGHCIAVDPWFIVDSAKEEAVLIRTARHVNDDRPHRIYSEVVAAAATFKNPTIACFGLSYKADIDDMRESPAIEIVKKIIASDIFSRIHLVEPYTVKIPEVLQACIPVSAGSGKPSSEYVFLDKADNAIYNADILLLLVNHKEFIGLKDGILPKHTVIDTRGIWADTRDGDSE
jgi:UDP-N-acetyl-D-mannosaminuronic acid dehydrogenase